MARALRIEFEDALYHVCARGNARDDIFRTEVDRDRFAQLLEHSAERLLHYSAVAQRIRRIRTSYSEKTARALIAEVSNV